MMKAVWTTCVLGAALALATPVAAQSTDTATVSLTVNVSARAKLTLSTGSVTFADANPDVSPTLSSSAINVDAKVRTGKNSTADLTVVADGDFTTGSDTIAITNLTWTVTGSGFVTGTMDKTTAQSVGSWTGSGNHSGSQTLVLANDWAYNVGSYTAILTYTLTAP